MIVNLDKTDLINLIKGIEPPYSMLNQLTKKNLGKMWGGHNETWEWNKYALEELTEIELFTFYQLIRKEKDKLNDISVSYELEEIEENLQEISDQIQDSILKLIEDDNEIFIAMYDEVKKLNKRN